MKPRVGRLQRAVWRSFVASQGAPLLTRDLMARAWIREARYEHKHYRSLARAARRYAIKLGRCGKGNLWAPNAELALLIRGACGEQISPNSN
jgi:hypothetical protein